LGAGTVAPMGSLDIWVHAFSIEGNMNVEAPSCASLWPINSIPVGWRRVKTGIHTLHPNLKVIYSQGDLSGPEIMVAILSSTYIGSPGSATSGFGYNRVVHSCLARILSSNGRANAKMIVHFTLKSCRRWINTAHTIITY
jgi:hypothetical protein